MAPAEGAGGGGGFSGGGGGGGGGGAGGGGSLNTAFADIVANSGVRLGDGELDISLVSPAMSAPEPSTWAMLLIGFAGLASWPIGAIEGGAASESIARSGFRHPRPRPEECRRRVSKDVPAGAAR